MIDKMCYIQSSSISITDKAIKGRIAYETKGGTPLIDSDPYFSE